MISNNQFIKAYALLVNSVDLIKKNKNSSFSVISIQKSQFLIEPSIPSLTPHSGH